jgi:hypothetical protein
MRLDTEDEVEEQQSINKALSDPPEGPAGSGNQESTEGASQAPPVPVHD